jgi:NADH-quinone oxidoreductase subunit D
MAERTVEYAVTRNPELAAGRTAVRMPVLPAGMEPELHGEHMLINIGPQHPATHGVLRLVLELDGEVVIKCTPHIGYLHSSFEKIGEYRTWNQIIPLTDRMDYLAPLIYNCAYAMAVEKLMGVEVTERCKVVRVICMELDRIFSHLLWLGTTAIDIGAFTVFLWTFQERERIYDLHESLTGARITTSATRVGGMMADLPVGWIDALQRFVNELPRTLDEAEAMLTNNGLWVGRNVGIGTISAEDAINCGLTGPNLRSTGVTYDLRKDRPYYDYETYDFDVIVGEKGDNFDRYLCRMEEMRQSLRILQQAIDRLPGGPINVDDPRLILPGKTDAMADMESMIHHFKIVMEGIKAPVGETWYSVESSKGELGMGLVSDGGSKPVRWRVRGPSFVNLSALPRMVEGHLLSDVIATNASIDIVLGEIDR